MQPRLTRILTAGAVAGALMAAGTPAGASGSGGAWTDGGGVGAVASDGAITPGSGGGGGGGGGSGGGGGGHGGSANPCSYVALGPQETAIANQMVASGLLAPGSGPGAWYRMVCPGSGVVLWLGAGAPPPPAVVVDPRALAIEALRRAEIPDPVIGMSPPAGQDQVVNLPTWLWVGGWRPVTATAAAGGVAVTVTATPDHVVWTMGNGGSVSCAGPGTAYDPGPTSGGPASSCSYTYRASSASAPGGVFNVRAATTWRVAWTATGMSASGTLPAVTRSSSVTTRVAEIQAINPGADSTGGRR